MVFKNKAKGARCENELYDLFIEAGYRCIRCAGSGTKKESCADLIAGKQEKKFCVEVKSGKKTSRYITKEQINDFMIFSEIFGLEPVVAVKFNRQGWHFLSPKDLEDSGKQWCVSLKLAQERGKRFSQFFS